MNTNPFIIRNSRPEDLERMQQIFAQAREKMVACGNPNQWTGGYPTDEMLLQDMANGTGYVLEQEGEIVGSFMLAPGIEPTYIHIYEGKWLAPEKPYLTIHRIASAHGIKGVLPAVCQWVFERTDNIRIDTHRQNAIMHHLLRKEGFTYCGIIYLEDGDERLAYQKLRS